MVGILIKRVNLDSKTDTRRLRPQEDGDRDSSYEATSEEHLGLPEAGRGEAGSSFGGFGGSTALSTPWCQTPSPWSCKRMFQLS